MSRDVMKECEPVEGSITLKNEGKNLNVVYILLAMRSTCHYNDLVYKYIKSLENDDLPLGSIRREWLNAIMDIHDKCFTNGPDHILPMLKPDRKDLQDEDKRSLLHLSYEILSNAICKVLFNNVKQLIYGDFVQNVPDVEGMYRYISRYISVMCTLSFNYRNCARDSKKNRKSNKKPKKKGKSRNGVEEIALEK